MPAARDEIVEIKTADGTAPCHFFTPASEGNRPAIILYMDAFGVRPALLGMARRLATWGYFVLLPNLYYRAGPSQPIDPAIAFKEGPERDRLMAQLRSLSIKMVMADTAQFLAFFAQQPRIMQNKIGCVGYCMGGGFALSAAGTYSNRIAVAASLHGARLATDQPDSPHLLAPEMRAAVYVGIAGIDSHFTPEEKHRLESALARAGVKHQVEVYPGVKHGFAVTDTPAYDTAASEHHWQQLEKLFAENLL